jgi:predicted esterase
MLLSWVISGPLGLARAQEAVPPQLRAGQVFESRFELPAEQQRLAARGQPVAVTHGQLRLALPQGFAAEHSLPVLLVSATSDPGYNSSRGLAALYEAVALDAGWAVLSVDAAPVARPEDEGVALRFALLEAALLSLRGPWPALANSGLAFAGFSGGAKVSGSLAALFANQGAQLLGLFQGGINEETLAATARLMPELPADFKRVPIVLAGGRTDPIATPVQHRRVESDLRDAGFKQVRLLIVGGGHVVDPRPLGEALAWFAALAAARGSAR